MLIYVSLPTDHNKHHKASLHSHIRKGALLTLFLALFFFYKDYIRNRSTDVRVTCLVLVSGVKTNSKNVQSDFDESNTTKIHVSIQKKKLFVQHVLV